MLDLAKHIERSRWPTDHFFPKRPTLSTHNFMDALKQSQRSGKGRSCGQGSKQADDQAAPQAQRKFCSTLSYCE
jgi:hypothetical protein